MLTGFHWISLTVSRFSILLRWRSEPSIQFMLILLSTWTLGTRHFLIMNIFILKIKGMLLFLTALPSHYRGGDKVRPKPTLFTNISYFEQDQIHLRLNLHFPSPASQSEQTCSHSWKTNTRWENCTFKSGRGLPFFFFF